VQVTLRNDDVPDGVTLHWHGLDVPNGDDGVAGVTQDAVLPGTTFTYRFTATQAGTFWYHSAPGVVRAGAEGLRGGRDHPAYPLPDPDRLALVHLYAGKRTVNGVAGDVPVPAPAGSRVRVRVVNTDDGPMSVWVGGAAFRVVSIDGTDLHEPGALRDTAVDVRAGGTCTAITRWCWRATGSRRPAAPWWVDSLNVEDGASYDIAFVADNPGIWMDHRHNLTHAAEGLVAHLMYEGVTEPYVVGGDGGNAPE
jgi:FtsP/CotA-like multicopper oxidase with cupredoxin domain